MDRQGKQLSHLPSGIPPCRGLRQNWRYILVFFFSSPSPPKLDTNICIRPGNLLNTYQVEDKKQVAEFDPLAWLDENPEEEEESRPCIVCNSAEHEDLTLLCDGCDTPYHTHCIGLETVPEGSWLCMECADRNGFVLPFSRPPRAAGRSRGRRAGFFPRTQASMRSERTRARTDQWLGAWGQFSSHILGASGIDLDSNDDGDDGLGEYRRSQQLREGERREWQRWQQRLRIASRLGAGDVFARNIQDGVEHQVAQPPQQAAPTTTITTQTREERQAWRDFERARAATPGGRKRKSRSVTASPVEPVPEPARPLKRPRTRRIAVQTEAGPSRAASAVSSSNQQHSERTTVGPSPTTALSPAAAIEEAPSFLSSLLQEVEQTAPSDNETVRSLFGLAQPVDPSSPVTSPSASTHNSPRAMSLTPPPQPPTANAAAARSASRSPGLSSHIEPLYPPANYSPTRSNGESSDSESRPQRQAPQTGSPELRQPRPRRQLEVRLPRSQDVSPTRKNLPLEVKENISQVVRAALKPHWKSSQLSADQYATINRNISHRIYEEVKDPTTVDDDAKRHWEKIATSEVARAVAELKS